MQRVFIVDYGMGNLNSVKKKLEQAGVAGSISSLPGDILNADKIILPGVGHFKKAMQNLEAMGMLDVLNEMVHIKQRPILGICLGMQLMAMKSEEGNTAGLQWFDAEVIKFRIHDNLKYKVPHTGWNQVGILKESRLMKDIPDLAEFYFNHSFHFKVNDNKDALNETDFGYAFASAIEKNNIYGVQYHPEKSHHTGDVLFKNFIEL